MLIAVETPEFWLDCRNRICKVWFSVIGETDQRRVAQTDDVGAARREQRLDRHPFGRPLPFGHGFTKPEWRCLALAMPLRAADTLQGIAHHPGLGRQRLGISEPQHAMRPGNAGNPARKRCGLCR